MGVFETLVLKENLSSIEKLVLLRELLKREMDVLNEYCKINHKIPKDYAIELCHLHNIKKVNIARLLNMIKHFDPKFMQALINTDPRVRKYISYYFDFMKKHPYFEEVLEPQNLFGDWDYIRYKLKIFFPELTFDEIDRYKFKRKEFIEYVRERLGEPEELVEEKLTKATWYETVPYLELESEMDSRWHPEPIMTETDWEFIRRHINGRKNIIIRGEDGEEKLIYVEVNIPEEELDKYKRDREGLKKLLMKRYNIDESGAEQILRKAGWESDSYHIIPPIHTDVHVDYGDTRKNSERPAVVEKKSFSMSELTAHIRYIGGLELELLNYWELLYERLHEVEEKLTLFIRTKRRLLGKLFGIYYTLDPVMAEAILTYDPEVVESLKELVTKTGVRDKKFVLYENKAAWEEVKKRIVSRFPEVSGEEIEKFKGDRKGFLEYLAGKLKKDKSFIDEKLEEAGWLRSEEIPSFVRHIGP
ncbi:hypothetical protein BCF55_0758 [Hydrogenivirga caldilitoris]|uniref:Uncharacterized protein n=1 Tax=Hydrogenivirga caldilitoris TaxID=246264 RepID=A0A497XU88_9AQUI|nr:hypothetical protein [Hydrogenivirga caldilitoris]RLJ70483.1 hypothetical protein BCF55_0758 [Hydrogenivirga caldilitoris]